MKKLLFLPLIFLFTTIIGQSKDDLYSGLYNGNNIISKNKIHSDSTTSFLIGIEYGITNKYFSQFFNNTKGLTIGFKKFISNKASVYLNFGYSNLEGKTLLNLNFLGKNTTIRTPTIQMLSIIVGPTIKSKNFGFGLGFGITDFINNESKTNSSYFSLNPYMNYKLDNIILELKNQYTFTDIEPFNLVIFGLKYNINRKYKNKIPY